MSRKRLKFHILRLMAALLAAALCFGFAPAVFAMESGAEVSETEIPETETPATPEATEEEAPKITSGSCGANLSWNFSGGTLTISGSGEMTDFPESTMAPWYPIREEIFSVVFPEGLTSVGSLAFYDCFYLTAVKIPSSVEKIGEFAFASCDNLKILNTGSGLKSIGKGAFYGCVRLVSITFPETLRSIGNEAFYSCESLVSIKIPETVTDLGFSVFAYCVSLVRAELRCKISVLPEWMFFGCSKLSEVVLPDTISDIGTAAFEKCDSLTNVYYNGENIPPEELQEEIGGSANVSEGSSSGTSTGGVIADNGDGTVTSENTTVTEGENSTVSATTETTVDLESGTSETSEAEVDITISGESGWEESAGAVEDVLDEHGTNPDGSEKHIEIEIFLQGTETVDSGFVELIAGRDVTVTITTENGSVWVINGKDINVAELSGNYSLAYVLEAGSAELCEKLGASSCFVLKFLAPAEINAEVLIRIGGNYARQNATLFKDGKEVEKVQTAVVDGNGYAHFYLGSVTEKKEYYIGMNVPGASEEAIIPQNMLAEYGNPEYIEPIKYEITGRTSSWGMNLGQVMSILAVVMVTVIIVVGAVMFFWNKQRLKNGYVPSLEDEEQT